MGVGTLHANMQLQSQNNNNSNENMLTVTVFFFQLTISYFSCIWLSARVR